MIDNDFKIERPKRYYRQGLNLLTHPETALDDEQADQREKHEVRSQTGSSIRSRLSKIFHVGHHRDDHTMNGSLRPPDTRNSRERGTSYDGPSSPETSGDEEEGEGEQLARQITPILDPSTNTNPLLGPDEHNEKNPSAAKDKKKRGGDVSKHTFYIENSQMRLKLFARNEVRPAQYVGI